MISEILLKYRRLKIYKLELIAFNLLINLQVNKTIDRSFQISLDALKRKTSRLLLLFAFILSYVMPPRTISVCLIIRWILKHY